MSKMDERKPKRREERRERENVDIGRTIEKFKSDVDKIFEKYRHSRVYYENWNTCNWAASPDVQQKVDNETEHFVPGALDYPEDRTKCSAHSYPLKLPSSDPILREVNPNELSKGVPSLAKSAAVQASQKTPRCWNAKCDQIHIPPRSRPKVSVPGKLEFERSSQDPTSDRGCFNLNHVDAPDNMKDDRLTTAKWPSLDASGTCKDTVGSLAASAPQNSDDTIANYPGVSAEGPGISPRVVSNLTLQKKPSSASRSTSGGLLSNVNRSRCDEVVDSNLDQPQVGTSVQLPHTGTKLLSHSMTYKVQQDVSSSPENHTDTELRVPSVSAGGEMASNSGPRAEKAVKAGTPASPEDRATLSDIHSVRPSSSPGTSLKVDLELENQGRCCLSEAAIGDQGHDPVGTDQQQLRVLSQGADTYREHQPSPLLKESSKPTATNISVPQSIETKDCPVTTKCQNLRREEDNEVKCYDSTPNCVKGSGVLAEFQHSFKAEIDLRTTRNTSGDASEVSNPIRQEGGIQQRLVTSPKHRPTMNLRCITTSPTDESSAEKYTAVSSDCSSLKLLEPSGITEQSYTFTASVDRRQVWDYGDILLSDSCGYQQKKENRKGLREQSRQQICQPGVIHTLDLQTEERDNCQNVTCNRSSNVTWSYCQPDKLSPSSETSMSRRMWKMPFWSNLGRKLFHSPPRLLDQVYQIAAVVRQGSSKLYNSSCNSNWRLKKKLAVLHEIFKNDSGADQVEMQILPRVKSTTELPKLETPLVLSRIQNRNDNRRLVAQDCSEVGVGMLIKRNKPASSRFLPKIGNSRQEQCDPGLTNLGEEKESVIYRDSSENTRPMVNNPSQQSTDQKRKPAHFTASSSPAGEASVSHAETVHRQQLLLSNRPKGAGQR